MPFRYGAWHGGPDPLEAPYDIRRALDEMGDDVLAGMSPRSALSRLMRQGTTGSNGLEALRQRARRRAKELRNSGRLNGTLDQVRELLDKALEAERAALFPDPDDLARMAEAELDNLPEDTARAVRDLADYQWRSPEAAQAYQEISELLRSEVLDAQFAGMRQALSNPDPQAMQAIREMMHDLNEMLDADARGEHTQEQFADFMDKHGEFFPENPENLAELVDSLARRAAAAERLMNSLSAEQRAELGELMEQALAQSGLAGEMSRLQQSLRAARPDLRWTGRERMNGDQPMGYADGTSALSELADLDELADLALQDYPGASLGDIDEELVQRALGQGAVTDLEQLKRIEQELRRQGYLDQGGEGLQLSPKALRRLGSTALRRVFAQLESGGRGDHDVRDAGAAGEITGASRAWQFGDEQPLDVVRTVRNAVLRGEGRSGARVRFQPEDFEVVETERRSSAAVALLVDMSYSMELRGSWGEAKTTALALHALVTMKYPQDAIEIIGFADYARTMSPRDLVDHDWQAVQGTNLQHALMLARRHLDRHRDAEPVILVITDGEPTAHLAPDGFSEFSWPPSDETIAATLAEVERCTRRGATINVFMLDDEPRLVNFMHEVGQRNGGRVFLPKTGALGEYVVSDYLSARGGRRRGGSRRAG
ncbi:VWA domain-containing protein [Jatrophihabitans telluris]|uniref:VWA domain-containing protein n=1 Tax=Jatrophihabitans telluris TaxID=2038343 RepID=A0ABY4R126_9ACTN|nr:VWA domain-containing protein [Jatrophihabitans telluris]UQX89453.1 VWA domain-containing protein [Jatrophihabitans telluris]